MEAELSRLYSLSSAFFSLLFGYLSDRFGRKPFILLGLLSLFERIILDTIRRVYGDVLSPEILIWNGNRSPRALHDFLCSRLFSL